MQATLQALLDIEHGALTCNAEPHEDAPSTPSCHSKMPQAAHALASSRPRSANTAGSNAKHQHQPARRGMMHPHKHARWPAPQPCTSEGQEAHQHAHSLPCPGSKKQTSSSPGPAGPPLVPGVALRPRPLRGRPLAHALGVKTRESLDAEHDQEVRAVVCGPACDPTRQ